jgi:hypothetical protein
MNMARHTGAYLSLLDMGRLGGAVKGAHTMGWFWFTFFCCSLSFMGMAGNYFGATFGCVFQDFYDLVYYTVYTSYGSITHGFGRQNASNCRHGLCYY